MRTAGPCLALFLVVLAPLSVHAQELQRILDKLNIFRAKVDDRGITVEAVNTNDILSNVSGGLRRRTAVAGQVNLLLTLDSERLVGWRGGTAFVAGFGTYGEDPSDNVGDAQGVSSIAAPNSWKLFEGWYQQNLFDERISLLAGLYQITSEFDVVRSASEIFVNSSFGTNPTFSFSGRNGPSDFPNTTSLALRGQAEVTDQLTFRAVVADGVPGDPDDPNGTEVTLKSEDGIVAVGELAYYLGKQETRPTPRDELPSGPIRRLAVRRLGRAAELVYAAKFAVGAWGYTTELEDLSERDGMGDPVVRDGTYGIYGLAEGRVYNEPQDPAQGLTLFGQAAFADPRVNRFSSYFGLGVIYTGLIPGREEDDIALGVAFARNGSHYKSGEHLEGRPVSDQEVALELNYAVPVTSVLTVQPDFQYIINPGTNPDVDNAVVIGVRLEVLLNVFK